MPFHSDGLDDFSKVSVLNGLCQIFFFCLNLEAISFGRVKSRPNEIASNLHCFVYGRRSPTASRVQVMVQIWPFSDAI